MAEKSIADVLHELISSVPKARSVLIFDVDGLVMNSASPEEVGEEETEILGGMLGLVMAGARKAFENLGLEGEISLWLQAENGGIMVTPLDKEIYLGLYVGDGVPLGAVRVFFRRAARELRGLLQELGISA